MQNSPSATPQQIAQAITANATTGKVTSSGAGSPNLLLHSLSSGPIEPPPVVVSPAVSTITVTPGGGRWVNAKAVVKAVAEGTSNAASGLGVTGKWFLDGSRLVATQTGVTDSTGSVSFSASVKVRTGKLNFCVTSLQGAGYKTVSYATPVCGPG